MNNENEELKKLVTDLNLVIEKVCDNIVKNNERTKQYDPIEDMTYHLVFLKDSKSFDKDTRKRLSDINLCCYQLAEELKVNHYNPALVEEVESKSGEIYLMLRKTKKQP